MLQNRNLDHQGKDKFYHYKTILEKEKKTTVGCEMFQPYDTQGEIVMT